MTGDELRAALESRYGTPHFHILAVGWFGWTGRNARRRLEKMLAGTLPVSPAVESQICSCAERESVG